MTKTHPAKGTGRSYSPADHAKALAVILQEEFDALFLFQDAKTGAVVEFPPAGLPACGQGEGMPQKRLGSADIAALAAGGRVQVMTLEGSRYRVALPLYSCGQPILVATAVLAPLARGEADAKRERRRLEKWAQSVCERLRSSDYILSHSRGHQQESTQTKTAWEALLTLDHLLTHIRIHKNVAANQERILQAAFGLLGVETLLLVPRHPDAPVLIQGETPIAAADCRQLALLLSSNEHLLSSRPLICNELEGFSWGARFPFLANLMAFAVKDQIGWVMAINKKRPGGQASEAQQSAPFRHSDAALLTPFIGLLGMQARAAGRYADLKDLLVGLTRSLSAALDARDQYTCGHSERVARIGVELGTELGMSEDELSNVYLAGLLHDIGKIGVRDAVLWKAGSLTPEEREHMQQHVTIGHSILSDLHQFRDLLPGVLYHHERYDGGGYPERLVGEAIPLLARILAVADAYDAMTTTRPYRNPLPPQQVEEILTQGGGKQWDQRVVEAFQRCRLKIHAIRQRGVGESLRQALDGAMRMDGGSSVVSSKDPVPVI
jgi:HD-GYP domain-containing protein (c-di-GMP phosphodiesterase class II)